ncbi:hypothetical protein NC651_028274 [Populus alba x Populus x berolinensis]|nr:hypothetical protein NC651_028269 [Populus alba x Populus x berolinensis]KAJ6881624.1 hypothetical protein NC651_028274 [Populus alba x Populus x berolinensis]
MIILLATKSSHETRSRSIQLSVVLISIMPYFNARCLSFSSTLVLILTFCKQVERRTIHKNNTQEPYATATMSIHHYNSKNVVNANIITSKSYFYVKTLKSYRQKNSHLR